MGHVFPAIDDTLVETFQFCRTRSVSPAADTDQDPRQRPQGHRLRRRRQSGAVDAGEKPAVLSAIVKAYLTQGMRTIMADAMDIFTQGSDGEMFDRPGTPWPEVDITVVDLATYAREGYNAQLSSGIRIEAGLTATLEVTSFDQYGSCSSSRTAKLIWTYAGYYAQP